MSSPRIMIIVGRTANQGLLAFSRRELREGTFWRDGYKCVACGSTEKMVLHHKIYRDNGCYEFDDFCTLCAHCNALYKNQPRRKNVQKNGVLVNEQHNALKE